MKNLKKRKTFLNDEIIRIMKLSELKIEREK